MQKQFKKVFLAGILMLLLVAKLFAQAPGTLWTKTYGGTGYDLGSTVKQTSDGGYIVVGSFLIKADANGDSLWTKPYEGSSVQQTSDGGYIIAGSTSSLGTGGSDVHLIKTDANGNIHWEEAYGGANNDVGESVRQTSDGGYIVAGTTRSFGLGKADVYLIKTGTNGDITWTRTYGGTDHDGVEGDGVRQTSDGGYIIAGFTRSFGAGERDMYLIKTDARGDTIWTNAYGGIDADYAWSVRQTSDGGYIIVGYTDSYDIGGGDIYLLKTDARGNTVWAKNYGGNYDDDAFSAQETFDGGYIVAGYTSSFGINTPYYGNVWIIKTDANGDTLWTKTCGGPQTDGGTSVQQTPDGGYIITGVMTLWNTGGDICLIKIKSETSIEEEKSSQEIFFISQAEPNPFSQQTVIRYACPCPSKVCIKIYALSGRLMRTFNHSTNQPFNQIVWDGKNNAGEKAPNGVYVLKFNAGKYNATRKLLIIR